MQQLKIALTFLISCTVVILLYVSAQIFLVPNETRVNLFPRCSPVLGNWSMRLDFDPFLHQHIQQVVSRGGKWRPSSCEPWSRVAIIVPFRDRHSHLQILLQNLHLLLQKQLFDYQFFVFEHIANLTFNKAKLMNAGFTEAKKLGNFSCYIFHDVDTIPESDQTLYNCSNDGPTLLALAITEFSFHSNHFGTATAATREQYERFNGHSNEYWGWGGEDDDCATRIRLSGQRIVRASGVTGRYKMLTHGRDKGNEVNPKKDDFANAATRNWKVEGLNSLQYTVLDKKELPLYTWFLIDTSLPNIFK